MKKLLIATAALAMVAGTVQAQSSVSVYGILDMGYASESKTATTAAAAAQGTTTKSKAVGASEGLSGSRLGFRGTEDLGGGLTAGFTYELGLNVGESTAAHSVRQSLLSLSDKKLGSLSFGRGNTLGKNTNDGFTAFGGGGDFEQGSVTLEITRGEETANGVAVKVKPIADRNSNLISYVSPSFSGVTLSAQLYAKSVDKDDSAGKAETSGTAFQLAYAGNGITAAYTRSQLDAETETTAAVAQSAGVLGSTAVTTGKTEITLDQFGATYTMGAIKVFGLYNSAKYKASATAAEDQNKGYDIGATYTMGKTTLLASIGDGEMKTAAGVKTDIKGMQAQVRYELSKRTTAYALYGKTELEGTNKGESDVSMIGIRHSF